jgi:hypothetical protein
MVPVIAAICIAAAHRAGQHDGEPPALHMPAATFPKRAASAAGFAPRGWKVEKAVKGDLNKDGRPDLAIVLKGADPNCIVQPDGTPEPMDTNPRVVLVAFGMSTGFSLQLVNSKVIPRISDPYMDDPLNLDAFTIRRNVLRLGLTNWRSIGGWTTFSSTFSFRWDGKRMRLIGFDQDTTHRNSGATEALSANLVTGILRTTTGSMEDDHVGTVRSLHIPQKLEALETMDDGLAYEPKRKVTK